MSLLGEVGLGSVKAGYEAKEMVAWARKYGIQSTIHTGGPLDAGLGPRSTRTWCWRPTPTSSATSTAATPRCPMTHVCELCEQSSRAHRDRAQRQREGGHRRGAGGACELGCPHRVILGTDGPAGSGVQPLGILRMVSLLSSPGATSRPSWCSALPRATRRACASSTAADRAGPRGPTSSSWTAASTPPAQPCWKSVQVGRYSRRGHGDDRRHRALRAQPQHAAGHRGSGGRLKGAH